MIVGLVGLVAFCTLPAGAQDDSTPRPAVQVDEGDGPLPGIIPKPNSGSAPTDAADRGGALQLALLGLIVLFFAIAVVSIRRQVRNARPAPGGDART